jgi:hypothetical protein
MESRQRELFVLESIDRRARIGLRRLLVLTHCAISLRHQWVARILLLDDAVKIAGGQTWSSVVLQRAVDYSEYRAVKVQPGKLNTTMFRHPNYFI